MFEFSTKTKVGIGIRALTLVSLGGEFECLNCHELSVVGWIVARCGLDVRDLGSNARRLSVGSSGVECALLDASSAGRFDHVPCGAVCLGDVPRRVGQ